MKCESNMKSNKTKGNIMENEQLAEQIGQQVGQELNQAMDSMMTKLSAMLDQKTSGQSVFTEEKAYDIGTSEAWQVNLKRMHDEYQHESLTDIRAKRTHFDNKISNTAANDEAREKLNLQATQNAIETANMVAKQAVRHSDMAIDRQWNVDEQSAFVSKVLNSIQDPAIASAMAAAIAEAMLKKD